MEIRYPYRLYYKKDGVWTYEKSFTSPYCNHLIKVIGDLESRGFSCFDLKNLTGHSVPIPSPEKIKVI